MKKKDIVCQHVSALEANENKTNHLFLPKLKTHQAFTHSQ
jgi:hypothetical protein